MKHSIITVLATLAFCASTYASEQVSTSRSSANDKMKLVPSLGYTYFNIQGSQAEYKSKGGNSAAVLIQMPVDTSWEFETGLEYLEANAKQSVSLGIFELETTSINVSNLAIPLRMKYSFNAVPSEGTHWYGKAGLTPTYIMSAKMETLEGSQDIKSDLNAFNILTQAGVGADWAVGMGGRIAVDLSYNYGLMKVSKNDDGRVTGFQLQAGYSIEL